MVSFETIAMQHPAICEDDKDADHQSKIDMMRGSTASSVLSRRLSRKVSMETEGTSTTDTDGSESRHESDSMSDMALDLESIPEAYRQDDMPETACPFDFVPSVRVCPAFSEGEVFQTETVTNAPWQKEVRSGVAPAMALPQMQPMPSYAGAQPMPSYAGAQPMPMPPFQFMATRGAQPMAMQQMPMQSMMQMVSQSMASCAQRQSQGTMMVPVPVPMPSQMPFSMPQTSVPVPPGFKLVKIPEAGNGYPKVQAPEKKSVSTRSAISNPASTERKIFVGGLNPSTTSQTLREYFSTFGEVMDAKVIREGEKSKGFGFVQFKDCIPAAVLEASAHIIDQRRCGVGPAFHRDSSEEEVA
jgi:hypothetical protein